MVPLSYTEEFIVFPAQFLTVFVHASAPLITLIFGHGRETWLAKDAAPQRRSQQLAD